MQETKGGMKMLDDADIIIVYKQDLTIEEYERITQLIKKNLPQVKFYELTRR